MCNRYIARRIDLRRLNLSILLGPDFEEFTEKPRFDPSTMTISSPQEMRPTDTAPVIRVVGEKIRVDFLKWGLIPPHEPEPKISYSTFNAKAETVATTRAYCNAWAQRQRCLVPVEAFFEWKGDKPPKQKYRISVIGEPQICLAGLWERWEKDGKVLETYTIITTDANELVAAIHDKKRMPVIIAPENYERWLRDTSDVMDLLKSYPSDAMEAHPVESDNALKHDSGPSLFSSSE